MRRRARGVTHGERGSRIQQVAARWNWVRTGEITYSTPNGTLDLEADGDATIKATAIEGWRRFQFTRDSRTKCVPVDLARRHITDVHAEC